MEIFLYMLCQQTWFIQENTTHKGLSDMRLPIYKLGQEE